MRPKYQTRALVLARHPLGEANLLLTLATEEVGLINARAQSVRRPGAKQAAALRTFAESSVLLVRGAEGWRVAGAVLERDWFGEMARPARLRAGRVIRLVLRLASSEATERRLFGIVRDFFEILASAPEEAGDAAEILAALRILSILGLDAGDIPEGAFDAAALAQVGERRSDYVRRVNRGIEASGL